MIPFAELNSNNIVINVTAGCDEDKDKEEELSASCINTWKRTCQFTSANKHSGEGTPFRKNYAGIGYTYDAAKDAFIAPQPFSSWTLNEDTCQWDAPVTYPDDGKRYECNEGTTSWDEVSE